MPVMTFDVLFQLFGFVLVILVLYNLRHYQPTRHLQPSF